MIKVTKEDIFKVRKPRPRYPVIDPIKNRFSPRYFSSEPIPEKDLNSIFEAARLAPSAYNYQPWCLYWTENNSSSFKKIINSLPELNYWAKTAAVLIVACYLPYPENNQDPFAQYDLGASVMSLILQAQSLGYYARQIGLFNKEKIIKNLKIQKDKIPYVIITLGKIGDYKNIEEVFLKKDIKPHPKKTKIDKKI